MTSPGNLQVHVFPNAVLKDVCFSCLPLPCKAVFKLIDLWFAFCRFVVMTQDPTEYQRVTFSLFSLYLLWIHPLSPSEKKDLQIFQLRPF